MKVNESAGIIVETPKPHPAGAASVPSTLTARSADVAVSSELEKLQREPFDYFLHETNPVNGLVLDKTAPDWPSSSWMGDMWIWTTIGVLVIALLVVLSEIVVATGEES